MQYPVKRIMAFTLLAVLIFGCTTKTSQHRAQEENNNIQKTLYTEGFTISEADDYKTVTVLNPWKKGEIHSKYYLVKDIQTSVPSDGKKIQIPLKSLVVNSATYLEFLQLLGVIDKVTGVCSAEYIYNPYILAGVQEGRIKDLGDSFNIDIENLLLLRPEIVMTPAYNAEDENSKRLENSGLSLVYNIEWQEKTPLGRAEWIKFIAAFFDKTALADSIFNEIAENYQTIKKRVEEVNSKPNIMSGQDFRGSWSMPGGNSFNTHLFEDAGANYFYASDNTSGSITTNIENALINFQHADVWVGAQTNTLEELGKIDSKYKLLQAYKTGNVYNYNKRMTAGYGNDYWESAVARPDILLADMVSILHPEILPDHELFYIQRLK